MPSTPQALFGFLIYRTGDRVLAEDLLADTFERALRARRRFDPRKASEKTWLYAIALNCLRDHARRRGTEGRALERIASGPSPGPTGEMEAVSDRDLISRNLGVLTRKGARGDRPALRRRPDRPGDRQADRRAAHDRGGSRVQGPAQAARGDGVRTDYDGTIDRSLLASAAARTMAARLTHSVGLEVRNSLTSCWVSGSSGSIRRARAAAGRGSMPEAPCASASA